MKRIYFLSLLILGIENLNGGGGCAAQESAWNDMVSKRFLRLATVNREREPEAYSDEGADVGFSVDDIVSKVKAEYSQAWSKISDQYTNFSCCRLTTLTGLGDLIAHNLAEIVRKKNQYEPFIEIDLSRNLLRDLSDTDLAWATQKFWILLTDNKLTSLSPVLWGSRGAAFNVENNLIAKVETAPINHILQQKETSAHSLHLEGNPVREISFDRDWLRAYEVETNLLILTSKSTHRNFLIGLGDTPIASVLAAMTAEQLNDATSVVCA